MWNLEKEAAFVHGFFFGIYIAFAFAASSAVELPPLPVLVVLGSLSLSVFYFQRVRLFNWYGVAGFTIGLALSILLLRLVYPTLEPPTNWGFILSYTTLFEWLS